MPEPVVSPSWMRRLCLPAVLLVSAFALGACSADDETRIVRPAETSVTAGTRLGDDGSTPRAGLSVGPDRPYGRRTPFVPLDNPSVLRASEASFLEDEDLVLGLNWEGVSRAYPIRMITFHHIVNDTLAGRPFLVTY